MDDVGELVWLRMAEEFAVTVLWHMSEELFLFLCLICFHDFTTVKSSK